MSFASMSSSRVARGAGVIVLLSSLVACDAGPASVEPDGGAEPDALDPGPGEPPLPPPNTKGPRALFVSETQLLEPLSLERVLAAILSTAEATDGTPAQLFRDWWDKLNTQALGVNPEVTHCDEDDPDSALNDFPFTCPSPEGTLASVDAFGADPLYITVGAVNRFDLAAEDGSNCGEHRLIFYALDREQSVSIEGVLPNPTPELGLAGCRPVLELWKRLEDPEIEDAEVTAALEQLFFDGLPGFAPVIHIDHLDGTVDSGQIVSNTETRADPTRPEDPVEWTLLEFAAQRRCEAGECRVEIERRPTGETPHHELLTGTDAVSLALQDAIIDQLAVLDRDDLNEVRLELPAATLASESIAVDPLVLRFSELVQANAAFSERLSARRAELGLRLTEQQLMNRAQLTTCEGCHRSAQFFDLGDGVDFRASFTHVDRGGNLSQAMFDVFLPHRRALLEGALSAD